MWVSIDFIYKHTTLCDMAVNVNVIVSRIQATMVNFNNNIRPYSIIKMKWCRSDFESR